MRPLTPNDDKDLFWMGLSIIVGVIVALVAVAFIVMTAWGVVFGPGNY